VKAHYDAHHKGRYKDREAEWQRIEQSIIQAGAEGRILGALDPHVRK
jgi:hypothetical protein